MTQQEANNAYRHRKKQDFVNIMGGKCAICGYNRSNSALEFHHINPKLKKFGIGKSHAIMEVLEELKKCILVCANCHREIHENLDQYSDLKSSYNEELAQEYLNQKKKSQNDKFFCIDCGKEILQQSTRCTHCSVKHKAQLTVSGKPTREKLKQLIRTTPFTIIGALYGVTDNAVRKWCDKYNLPRKKAIIKTYTDEEWDKI